MSPSYIDLDSTLDSSDASAFSFAECMSGLACWVSKYVLLKLTELDDEDVIMDTPNYRLVEDAVYEILVHPNQTPFTLIHLLYFLTHIASRGFIIPTEALYARGVGDVDHCCLTLRILFVLACEAMEEELGVEPMDRMSLVTKLHIAHIERERVAYFDDCRTALLSIVSPDIRDPVAMDDAEWSNFPDMLYAFAATLDAKDAPSDLPFSRPITPCEDAITLLPVVVVAFLDMAHPTSTRGIIPFVRMPVQWLLLESGVASPSGYDSDESWEARKMEADDDSLRGGAHCRSKSVFEALERLHTDGTEHYHV
ncbi:hypothetical protein CYLTODRAFT_492469 [Cylindrobasidium torrendii FP15055 ss-10]|uniref:Uncharacterized protein n=1 Tax=Cylindrobasidium torrendii FP15055 ss-10 TaxID=1314674 RepID=A0A0D7B502_9AGAR|nr:hypothetical protein CYLTODRAFT_492469 [Cylindrobasidium torrendii FP15055 ss-10]